MRIIAHRGYSGIAPENTIAAFRKAIEAGCGTIEFDVQLSQDSVPFVIHDSTIDRTTNGRGKVIEIPSDELCIYSAAYEDKFGDAYMEERLPTLEDALTFLKGKARALIEIKSESVLADQEDIEKAVVDLVTQAGMVDEAVVISFSSKALERVKRLSADINIGFLADRGRPEEAVDEAVRLGATLVLYHRSQVDRAKVDAAHARGMQCVVYTVDEPGGLERLLDLGIDGIGSNRPGELLRYLDQKVAS